MQLLDLYRSRFGEAVKRQGNGWNGPCPLCGGEPGKSDRFMVWPDRSDNLGEACSRNGINGIWSCRQCSASGDTIAYLMKIDGMTFKEALAELGIEGVKTGWHRRKAPAEPVRHISNAWTPKEQSEPTAEWQGRAIKLVEEAEKKIWDNSPALQWLKARGICEDAIKKFRLGYLEEESEKYHGCFRPRKAFGLPAKAGQDGKIHDKLFIPRGIVIPTFSKAGSVLNVRIRRHKTDLGERKTKYMELEGSYKGPLFLQSFLARPLAVYFITEAELDAMLIYHASGGVVGAVAVRTNRGKPDARCQPYLETAARICVALDYDSAGAEGCEFWEETYSTSVRWPVPEGKDPGDAFAQGVDILEWIEAALPASVSLPENESAPHEGSISQVSQEKQGIAENGQVEASASGQDNWGKGGKAQSHFDEAEDVDSDTDQETSVLTCPTSTQKLPRSSSSKSFWASESDFDSYERSAIRDGLRGTQLEIGDLTLDVLRLWLVWRQIPGAVWCKSDSFFHVEYRDECDYQRRRPFFSRLAQAVWDFPLSRDWLDLHPADEVTLKNFFEV